MNFLREIMQRSGRSLTFELRDSARSITVLLMDRDTTQCSGISAIKDHQQKLNGFKVKCHEVAAIRWGGEVRDDTARHINLITDNIKSQGGTVIGCCCFCNTNSEGKLDDLSASRLVELKAAMPDIKLFSDVDARASLLMPEKSEKDHATLSLVLGSKLGFVLDSRDRFPSGDLYVIAQHIHDFT